VIYVASPRYSDTAEARAANLDECLVVARRNLDETSDASDGQKRQILVNSAIEAGWSEEEVLERLGPRGRAGSATNPDLDYSAVPSSST